MSFAFADKSSLEGALSDIPGVPSSAQTPFGLSERSVLAAPPSLLAAEPLIDIDGLIATRKAEDVRRLFALEQLEVNWDEALGALWAFMRPRGRPSYNLALLDDIHAMQRGIVAKFAARNDLQYLVAGSRTPGVFSLGGDLYLFADCIRRKDRAALVAYGKSCVRVLHRFFYALNLPIISIGGSPAVGGAGETGRRHRDGVGRPERRALDDGMAARTQRTDEFGRKSALDREHIRKPLVMQPPLADRLCDRQRAVDQVEDHLQHGGDDAAPARRARHQEGLAVLEHDGGRHG